MQLEYISVYINEMEKYPDGTQIQMIFGYIFMSPFCE